MLVEAEIPMALITISLAVEGLDALGRKQALSNREEIIDFVLKFRMSDGSFGTRGSSIDSVYYAVKPFYC